jgi:argininosuccinate lyase
MSAPRLVFIESNTSGTGRLFAREARRLGFDPLLLAEAPWRYPFVEQDRVEAIRVDTADRRALLAAGACRSAPAGGRRPAPTTTWRWPRTSPRARLPAPSPGPAPLRDWLRRRLRLRAAGGRDGRRSARAGAGGGRRPCAGGGGGEAVQGTEHRRRLCHQPSGGGAPGAADQQSTSAATSCRRACWSSGMAGAEFSVEAFDGRIVGVTRKHASPASSKSATTIRRRSCARCASPWKPTRATAWPRWAWGGARRTSSCAWRRTARAPSKSIRAWRAASSRSWSAWPPWTGGRQRRARQRQPLPLLCRAGAACIRFLVPPRAGTLGDAEVRGRAPAAGRRGSRALSRAGQPSRCGDFRDRIGHLIGGGVRASSARPTALPRCASRCEDAAPGRWHADGDWPHRPSADGGHKSHRVRRHRHAAMRPSCGWPPGGSRPRRGAGRTAAGLHGRRGLSRIEACAQRTSAPACRRRRGACTCHGDHLIGPWEPAPAAFSSWDARATT